MSLLLDPEEQQMLQSRAMTTGLLNGVINVLGNSNRGWGNALATGLAGGLQGYQGTFDNAQQAKLMQQRMLQQDQEFGLRNQEYSLRVKEAERKAKEQQDRDAAIADLAAKNPEFAQLYRLDPTAAIKAAFPQASKTDPYYSPIYDAVRGAGYFNHRDGTYSFPEGMNIVKPSDSPALQGSIAESKARGQAMWKPNTDIPGVVSTDAEVASQVNGLPTNNFGTPYPVTFGAPGTTRQDQIEGTGSDSSVAVRNPASPNRAPVRGVAVPTPAEQERLKAQAKADVEVDTENKKEANKKTRSMAGIGGVIDEARFVLTNLDPTASGLGTAVDKTLGFFGQSTQGSTGAAKLKALGGNLIMKMPRMEGPQSDADRLQYRDMAGAVGDSTLPIADRLAALAEVERLYRKYDKESNIMSKEEKMPSKKLMPGQVVDGYKYKGGDPTDPNSWVMQ